MNAGNYLQITHHTLSKVPDSDSTQLIVNQIISRLKNSTGLHLPLDETIELTEQLSQFELGRFLIHNQGLNGYWTSYVFKNLGHNPAHSPLESWLLNRSLFVSARERFSTFQNEIQKRLKSNVCFASIPCGLMDDLVHLDFSGLSHFKLVGIDADPESLELAKENATKNGLQNHSTFIRRDAWNLGVESQFDLITSNGLNMYESNEERLVELYRNFYNALTPGGVLIISFLPPPPVAEDPQLICKKFNITLEDFKKDRAIFDDIVQVKYLNFCTEEKMIHQLEQACFSVQEIKYNAQGVAPIVIASK